MIVAYIRRIEQGNAISIREAMEQILRDVLDQYGSPCELKLVIGGTEQQQEDEIRRLAAKTLNDFNAIFHLAGIRTTRIWELPNAYDPRQRHDPWYLYRVEQGLIRIGWRKRVISIDWADTTIRGIVTIDDVTKEDHMVHAWTTEKAIEYLKAWKELIESA